MTKKVSAPRAKIFTYDDYMAMPDDGKRYEVIDGELLLVPAPNFDHQRVILNLTLILAPHVKDQDLGELVFAPFDVVLDQTNVVQPDMVFIAKSHLGWVDRDLKGPPDLAVEVLSPSTAQRNREVKLRVYEKHRVPHLWLLDPRSGQLEEYVLGKKKYRLATKLEGPKGFTPKAFEGLVIPLGKVWPKK